MLYSSLFRLGAGATPPLIGLGFGTLNCCPVGSDVRAGGGLGFGGAGRCVILGRLVVEGTDLEGSDLLFIDVEACLDKTMLRGASLSAMRIMRAGACRTALFL